MKFIDGISEIIDKYDFFILDIWGVIHDGREPYPNVNQALRYLKKTFGFPLFGLIPTSRPAPG